MSDPGERPPRPNIIIRLYRTMIRLMKTWFISVGILVTIMPVLLIWAVTRMDFSPQKSTKPIDDMEKVIVHMELAGPLLEHTPDESRMIFRRIMGEPTGENPARLALALRRAAEDIRVQGVLVEIGDFGGSLAAMTELRQAFKKFADSKKPLWFWLPYADSAAFYLATSGRIALAPVGSLEFTGPVFSMIYMGEALNKLGIDLEIIRAGKFKSAFEAFVANEPTPPTLEMYDSMKTHIASHLVDIIGPARGKSPDEVRVWMKRSLYTAVEAEKAGLIDRQVYFDQLKKEYKEQLKDARYVSPEDLIAASESLEKPRMATGSEKLAYIEAVGDIVMDAPAGSSGEYITPEEMTKKLRWAGDDDDIKAVVMRISSGGGSALASDMIWEEVRRLKEKKPVVVSMGAMAASGGYYIAAPASKILASPTSITGSIGVISAVPNLQAFREKYGLSFYVVTDSERSALINPGQKVSESDQRILGEHIGFIYDTFISKVGIGRGMKTEDVDRLGQGRVYTGAEALSHGLVDTLGGMPEAWQVVKKLAGLDDRLLYPVERWERPPRTPLDCLRRDTSETMRCMDRLDSSLILKNLLSGMVETDVYVQQVERLRMLIDDDRNLAIWPGVFGSGPHAH